MGVQKNHLPKEKKEVRTNIENLYNASKAAINFLSEYTPIVPDARYQPKKCRRRT